MAISPSFCSKLLIQMSFSRWDGKEHEIQFPFCRRANNEKILCLSLASTYPRRNLELFQLASHYKWKPLSFQLIENISAYFCGGCTIFAFGSLKIFCVISSFKDNSLEFNNHRYLLWIKYTSNFEPAGREKLLSFLLYRK